jgi:hypothetical protein
VLEPPSDISDAPEARHWYEVRAQLVKEEGDVEREYLAAGGSKNRRSLALLEVNARLN